MAPDELFNGSLKLKVLMVAAMAACLLVLAPWAQAAGAFTPGGTCIPFFGGQFCVDKTASPNPVNVGQPLTFTITFTNTGSDGVTEEVQDALPASVNFESAVSSSGSCPGTPPPGTPDTTVNCPVRVPAQGTGTVTISVIPTQCGTFTNTLNPGNDFTATADFTVKCPTSHHKHHRHHHHH